MRSMMPKNPPKNLSKTKKVRSKFKKREKNMM